MATNFPKARDLLQPNHFVSCSPKRSCTGGGVGGLSLPFPRGVVATDMSLSDNEGARRWDKGGGWGKQERKLWKTKTRVVDRRKLEDLVALGELGSGMCFRGGHGPRV